MSSETASHLRHPYDAIDADTGDEGDAGDAEESLEALKALPLEERRKALRRLRNRESARRVRARRVAEMSTMEGTVVTMQEENTRLRSHISQLQSHIQAMTERLYEVTAKYEAAVAENICLKTAQQQGTMFVAPEAAIFSANAAQAAPVQQRHQRMSSASGLSGAPSEATAGQAACEQQQQQQQQQGNPALNEVLALLQEHKRRSQVAKVKPKSAGSGSSAPTAPHAHSSPEMAMAGAEVSAQGQAPCFSSVSEPAGLMMGMYGRGTAPMTVDELLLLEQQQHMLQRPASVPSGAFINQNNMMLNMVPPAAMGVGGVCLEVLNREAQRRVTSGAYNFLAGPTPSGNSGALERMNLGCAGASPAAPFNGTWSSSNNVQVPAAAMPMKFGQGMGMQVEDLCVDFDDQFIIPQDL